MTVLRAALIQTCAGDDPAANLADVAAMIRRAAEDGAAYVQTPEVTNIVTLSRPLQAEVLRTEAEDATLAGLRDLAARSDIWLHVGSLALKSGDADGRFVNRAFLIAPSGEIAARYDKIHMFDVTLGEGERYRESSAYRPGDRAVVADAPWGRIGLSICYDMRFPALYRALAEAGAAILTAPSAFTVPTGRAHWHVLLRARAIETGCFMLAAAQTGEHPARDPAARRRVTYGHSIAIGPWGEVLAEAAEAPGVTLVDLDLSAAREARARVPALLNARAFAAPEPGGAGRGG